MNESLNDSLLGPSAEPGGCRCWESVGQRKEGSRPGGTSPCMCILRAAILSTVSFGCPQPQLRRIWHQESAMEVRGGGLESVGSEVTDVLATGRQEDRRDAGPLPAGIIP